ncbi:glycoside hydrolase family 32 protein [Bacillus sp. A301a_S52]|nr:glycoside hydrolase family 32 protein [Bacillus sp. A301a_S52]
MYSLEEANTYIKTTSSQVNNYYRHTYHVMAPVGWINDPNGFIYFKGEYHLFYQYYPYKTQWGPMHWGHVKSKDLINWENAPVALAPDKTYDKDGCFSGTAIEKDGKMYLMYTGHIEGRRPEDVRQVQCMAVSDDGIHFEKVEQNPVISEEDLPDNAKPQDFRDPKVLKHGECYYSLIASKAKEGGGQILLYKSKDLLDWEFVSVLLKGEKDEGPMWECPDLFELNGKDVLIISVEGLPAKENNFTNTHSVLSIIGKMDWEKGVFNKEVVEELDYGMDFYAPQTISDNKNRRVMISWMQMWGRNIPTHTDGHGWAGAMTLPRELVIKNNHLYQRPIPEVKKYYTNNHKMSDIILSNEKKDLSELSCEVGVLELDIDVAKGQHFDLELRSHENEKTVLSYDCHSGLLKVDRKQSGVALIGKEPEPVYQRAIQLNPQNHHLKLEIYFDRASVEVFVNEGEYTLTSTIYPTKKSDGIAMCAEGDIHISRIEKWDIKVSP